MALTILRRVFRSRSTTNPLLLLQRRNFVSTWRASTFVDHDHARSVTDRLQLSPLFQENIEHDMKECKIELVDDSAWSVSSGLANAWRDSNEVAAMRMRSCSSDRGNKRDDSRVVEHDFDDIEDLRIRGNLFYKIDRGSKEYEEYKFDFHGSKHTRNEREQRASIERRKKEKSDLALASIVEMASKNESIRKREMRDMTKENCMREMKNMAKEKDCTREMKNMSKEKDCLRERNNMAKKNSMRVINNMAKENCMRGVNTSKNLDSWLHEVGDASVKDCTRENNYIAKEKDSMREIKKSKNLDWLHEVGDSRTAKKQRTPTFNQLTGPYHEPFCLDVYISTASVRASIIHRATSNVVVVAHSISKDMKFDLGSTKNKNACASVGRVLAQRALADDIHNVVYTPRKGERLEGKLQIVVKSIIDGGVDVKVKLKQTRFKQGKHHHH